MTTAPEERQELLHNVEEAVEIEGEEQPGGEFQAAHADPVMPPPSRLIPVLAACWVPSFIGALDSTVVATLLTDIGSRFRSAENAPWLGTSFLIALCCCTPLYGRLCEALGRRVTLCFALSVFTIATAGCGIAPTMGTLIAARALAGAGVGGVTTTTSVVMSDLVPMKSRALFQGLTNCCFALGLGLGGPAGGYMAETLGWRAAFLFQIPLLLLALLLAFLFIRDSPHAGPRAPDGHLLSTKEQLLRMDVWGSVLLLIGTAVPLTSLSWTGANDVPLSDVRVWGGVLLGIVSLASFYYTEKYLAVRPILPLELLHRPYSLNGAAHAASNFFLSIMAFAFLYSTPVFFQAARGSSAARAGALLLPYSALVSVGSLWAGMHIRAHGVYYRITIVASGCTMFAMATYTLASAYLGFASNATSLPSWFDWILAVFAAPSSFGMAVILTTTLIALLHGVPRTAIPLATGMSYLFRQSGQVLGVGLGGLLAQSVLKSQLPRALRTPDAAGHVLPPAQIQQLATTLRHEPTLLSTLPTHLVDPARAAYAQSSAAVYILCFVAATGGLIANCTLYETDMSKPSASSESGTPARAPSSTPHTSRYGATDSHLTTNSTTNDA